MSADNLVRFLRDPEVIAQPSGDALVLFQMHTGNYFSLNKCGARVWEFCDGTNTEDNIAALIMEEYEAPSEVRADVSTLLLQLTGRGLVKAVDPD